ncbi:MAG: DUF2207 family protein [Clostridium sp.]
MRRRSGRSRLLELIVWAGVIAGGMLFLMGMGLFFDITEKYEGVVNPNPSNIPIIKYYKDFLYLPVDEMIMVILISLELIILVIVLIRWLNLKRMEAVKEKYWSELPDSLPPFAVKILLEKDTGAKDSSIAAEIAFFVEKGYIYPQKINNKYRLNFIKLPVPSDGLWKYQNDLFNLLYYEFAGEDKILEIEDFEKVAKRPRMGEYIFKKLVCIQMDVSNELVSRGYIKEKYSTGALSGVVFMMIIMMIPLLFKLIVSGYIFKNWLMIVFIIIAIFMMKLGRRNVMKKLTTKGKVSYKKWQSFNLFLENYSIFKDRGVQDLILWRMFLVYGTALELADKLSSEVNDLGMVELYKQMVKALLTGNLNLFT